MQKFDQDRRRLNLEKLSQENFDLCIIGGGINGAGVARDAASRGMKVALIEANDFAFGTSSRSSKLVHGGIRYLENYEFSLVFEALSERETLFEMAPHLVHPLRFMIPLYKNSRVGMFLMGAGMWLYDTLSLFEAPELHEKLNAKNSKNRMPILDKEGLCGSYIYSDAYMDDDRLVIETLRSANELSATLVNYVKAGSAHFESGKMVSVTATDQLTQNQFSIKAKHFVSTVGPWTDEIGRSFFQDWKPMIRPSKGIHIVLEKNRLPLTSAVVMAAEKGNRIVFAIPRHEMVIIGTTDSDYSGDLNKVRAETEDVEYVLKITNRYFPDANITVSDILSTYAGVRPLVKDDAESEGKTSREHKVMSDTRNITFVGGGKYTTYRKIAEDCMVEALNNFSIEDRVKFCQSDTKNPLNANASVGALEKAITELPLVGDNHLLSEDETHLLAQRHGLEALSLLKKYNNCSYWQIEAHHAIGTTMCIHLVDFYTRRTPLFLSRADNGLSVINEVVEVFQQRLGWSDKDVDDEVSRLKKHISYELGWKTQLQ